MNKIKQHGDTFIYQNDWHRDWECKMPTIVGTEIYTDKELMEWLDKKGEYVKFKKAN